VLKAHRTLPEFLAGLQECDQLLVFWRFFGHSGHLSRPPGFVIENYIACEDAPIFVVKSIVRPKTVITAHVHNCTTRSGLTKNDRGDHLRENWAHPTEVVSEDLIRINHYYTRSYAEYVAKIQRGQVDGRSAKKLEPFEKYDYRARDFQILSRVQATKDRIVAIKSLRQQPHRYGGLTNIGSISNPRNFVVFAQTLAKTLAPNARPVHDIFGTVVTFDDNRDAKGLSEVFRRNAGEWARDTNAAIVRPIGAGTHNMRSLNPDLGIAFEAINPNPELAIEVDDSPEGGFVWTAFLTEVPESTQIDLFALATDMHGSRLISHRRIGMAGPGLVAGFIMINDVPCRVQSVRIRPGAAPETYRVHCFMIFKGY
jgi:hypothetical protein